MFLATWKDIPNENEAQFQIRDCPLNAGKDSEPPAPAQYPCTQTPCTDCGASHGHVTPQRLRAANCRAATSSLNVEGQDMLYQSLKLTNGIWVLAELRIQPGNPSCTRWLVGGCSVASVVVTSVSMFGCCMSPSLLVPVVQDLELSLKCRAPEVSQHVYQAYETILKN
ncbi:hypothetical protein P7K49_002722 [Saguinus oedipus]|uniref:Beta-adaptin appendage C-terminal subdomain domain-containing protein n=1 Tax=Saguinus oedipus TaxID=9490 RepID=A0ABQ9WI81_SAGOE|nr:hypothetical protein P7K49_002722 [Saguinus oedipus]